MKDESIYPLALKIRDLEDYMVSDYMVGRMHESDQLRKCCAYILEILKIARRYMVVGKERKAARTFLRALGLRETLIRNFELNPG